jgi:hypothetical protein
MKVFQLDNMRISLDKEGAKTYSKTSYPIRYGRYAEIDYDGYILQCNLNGEIKHITGTGPDWPHPAEWLKRTIGNDWVYYSTGSYYAGTVDLFGEFYMPCPAYFTNSIFREDPFRLDGVQEAMKKRDQLVVEAGKLARGKKGCDPNADLQNFLDRLGRQSNRYLQQKADSLHRILQGRVSVLPPDCRHVDYDVMPVLLSHGCLYNCAFCLVKTGLNFESRSRENITQQLQGLREFFGADIENYNSVFLGQHDALASAPDDILFAAEKAYDLLGVNRSYMRNPRLFLFGSADSFLHTDDRFFTKLNRLPYYTYINLGLESFDPKTLEVLKKPVAADRTKSAFNRMLDINRQYEHIEITANFLLGEDLPASHATSLIHQLSKIKECSAGKGCVYISPLQGSQKKRELLNQFRDIKQKSAMETLLYLIQRV